MRRTLDLVAALDAAGGDHGVAPRFGGTMGHSHVLEGGAGEPLGEGRRPRHAETAVGRSQRHDDHPELFRDGGEAGRGVSGDGFGVGEKGGIFAAAEIERRAHLLQTDHLGAFGGGIANKSLGLVEIGDRTFHGGELGQSNGEGFHGTTK